MNSRQPTIKDIAQALGITAAAVSKALNDKPDISPDLKVRVKAWAAEHGYVPDLRARRLVTGSNQTLGVLLLNRFGRPVREYFGYHLLDGLQARCQEEDFDLVLLQEADSRGIRPNYLDLARRRGITALVVYGHDALDPQFVALAGSGLPIASVDGPLPGCPLVTSDQEAGIGSAVAHLAALGHRGVAYLGLRGDGWVARQRREGFRRVWAQVDDPPGQEVEGVLSVEGGRASGLALLGASPRPTAVVCASDLQAYGVLLAARDLGLSVPGDLSLTGFDDLHASAFLDPPLTTVAQDPARLGWLAADAALARWKQQPVADQSLVPTQLIVRASTKRSLP